MSQDYNEKLDVIPLVFSRLNESVDELIALCVDTDKEVRYTTIELLAGVKTQKIEDTVCTLLHDSDELVRTTCIEVLGSWNDTSKAHHVVDMLKDNSELVRSTAIVAIGDMGISTASELLKKMLPSCGEEEEPCIYYALYKLGKHEYLPLFLDGLFHDFYRVRCATANLSVNITNEKNQSFIINVLTQKLKTEETVAAKSSIQGAIETIQEMKTQC